MDARNKSGHDGGDAEAKAKGYRLPTEVMPTRKHRPANEAGPGVSEAAGCGRRSRGSG